MKSPLLVPELQDLVRSGSSEQCRDFCEAGHPEAIASFLSSLEPAQIWVILRHAPPHLRSDIFSRLEGETRLELAGLLRREELAALLTNMASDDRADLFREMPDEKRQVVLPALAQAAREDIRRLSSYREGTAAAIMTSDYAALAPSLTAAEAIERLRLEAPDRETIYLAYVLDAERRLLGAVSLKDLILARPSAKIKDIMDDNVIAVAVEDDQELAARTLQKYDQLAVPVVDENRRLVGIITQDDAFDVIVQEQTEDLEKIMAIAGSHEAGIYLKTPVWRHFKNRVGWVIFLSLLGLLSGFIIQSFEGLLLQFAVLATFIPMLADAGGNTGSQAATLVVRALALGEVRPRDILKVLMRETVVAVLLGLVLALVAFGRVLLFSNGAAAAGSIAPWQIGLAVAAALWLQVASATVIGAALPMIVAGLKLDPAIVARPALTTIVDITGLLIFFAITGLALGAWS